MYFPKNNILPCKHILSQLKGAGINSWKRPMKSILKKGDF